MPTINVLIFTLLCLLCGCLNSSLKETPKTLQAKHPKSFIVDNHLMTQHSLLSYKAFRKYIAVVGQIESIVKTDNSVLLYRISDPERSNLKVWTAFIKKELNPDFAIGDTLRVLGYPTENPAKESRRQAVKDDYLIIALCAANFTNGQLAYHRQAYPVCDHWQTGQVERIYRLTSRLK